MLDETFFHSGWIDPEWNLIWLEKTCRNKLQQFPWAVQRRNLSVWNRADSRTALLLKWSVI